MGTAIFKRTPTLDRIIAHAKQSGKPVLLVHDQGLYLMTSGLKKPDDPTTALCAYAQGCDPIADGDWWDNARDACGGDDFGEELRAGEIEALIRDGDDLRVDFSETHMTLRAA